ncbi:hypothetical protein FBU59_006950 [Linderina macrospora]|uniref:Uncharacterized protein n=1 Tax=Linderina macrospora TaxID=4868 RepID=A0ACC1IYE5_9FUNG|nr:hypothetical protein FBU59_006950 [Linderina macrospora]
MSAYWNGRYSSGPVWVEYTAQLLGYTLADDAYGGATTNNQFVYAQGKNGAIKSVKDAITDYLGNNTRETAAQRAGHYVLADSGGNDVFYSLDKLASGAITPSDFASNLISYVYTNVATLLDAGFRKIIIADIQPVGIMPITTDMGITDLGNTLETAIVSAHKTALASLKTKYGSAASNVRVFDLAAATRIAYDYQLTNAMAIYQQAEYCITTDSEGDSVWCSDVDNRFFIDQFHMTAKPQNLLGAVLYSWIKNPYWALGVNNFLTLVKNFNIASVNGTNNIVSRR